MRDVELQPLGVRRFPTQNERHRLLRILVSRVIDRPTRVLGPAAVLAAIVVTAWGLDVYLGRELHQSIGAPPARSLYRTALKHVLL